MTETLKLKCELCGTMHEIKKVDCEDEQAAILLNHVCEGCNE